ncbi:hypothetical protein H0H92_015777, partial [Tricholoma furcatifolium]
MEFSPFDLDVLDPKLELLKTARELGVRIKSMEDFEAGDFRRTVPKYAPENWPKILNVVSQFKEIATAHNATPGQVTLAWLLAQGDDFLVIPGTKKVRYLEENLGAAKIHLSEKEVASITKIAYEAEIP